MMKKKLENKDPKINNTTETNEIDDLEQIEAQIASLSISESAASQGESEGDSSDSSEYSLLDSDDTSDEKEILGGSFNVFSKGDSKFIPGNKIHKQLAYHQGSYIEEFFTQYNGEPRFHNYSTLRGRYNDMKQKYLKAQKRLREDYSKNNVKHIEEKKVKKKPNDDRQQSKKEELKKYIDKYVDKNSRYILTLKPQNKVCPNIAVAKLSYIKDAKMHSKCIHIGRGQASGHSEAQIFEQTLHNIQAKAKKKYYKADLIVLDIHTLMSMCSDCSTKAEMLIKEAQQILASPLLVRVSYHLPYVEKQPLTKNIDDIGQYFDIPGQLLQRQIEMPETPIKSKSFRMDSVILSSGYNNDREQRAAVQMVDTSFIKKKIIESFTSYNPNHPELTVPAGFIDVPRDGSCFYSAVAQQLDDDDNTAVALQNISINEILSNTENYKPFIVGMHPSYANMTPLEALEAYLNYHLGSRAQTENPWADHVMIHATANAIGRNIMVQMFDVHGQATHQNEAGNALWINATTPLQGQPIVVGNIGNVHFVAQDSDAALGWQDLTALFEDFTL